MRCCQNVECASCLSWVWAKTSTPLLLSWQKVPGTSPVTCSGVNPMLPVWVRLCRLRAWWAIKQALLWIWHHWQTKVNWSSSSTFILCRFLKLRYQKCLDARPPSLASCLPTPPTDSVARRVKKGVQSLLGSFKSYRSGSQSPWVWTKKVYTPLNTRSTTSAPSHSRIYLYTLIVSPSNFLLSSQVCIVVFGWTVFKMFLFFWFLYKYFKLTF